VAQPLNPLSLALGAEATFVARAIDLDRAGLTAVLSAAARHQGAAFVQILQDCPVFNPGEYDLVRNKTSRATSAIALRHGERIRFGPADPLGAPRFAVVRRGLGLAVVEARSVPAADVVVHDVADLELAFALSRLETRFPNAVVTGVLRAVSAQTFDDAVREQVAGSVTGPDLQALLRGADSWTAGHRPTTLEGADLLALNTSSTIKP
jgi:2-oxoglutarate ferredoxin oxidoreductase subunit beta